jgi:CMP-N-acetylneuraminic acid synthetase
MIRNKNITNITNAEYRSHLINTILNSKSLSKEIYNTLSPLEDLEVDSEVEIRYGDRY